MTAFEREILDSFFEARPEYLDAFFDEIDLEFGSFEAYARDALQLGVKQRAVLKTMLFGTSELIDGYEAAGSHTRSVLAAGNSAGFTRRGAFALAGTVLAGMALSGCSSDEPKERPQEALALPDAQPDPDSPFGVDRSINMDTVDDYVGRSDIVFRDLRMLHDPADYGAIQGNPDLDITIEGFKIVPYPYIGTLQELPVEGAYAGPALFDIAWSPEGEVLDAGPLYTQSLQVIEELFPRDKPLFLMCGGGGYAGMMRKLLLFLGYDERRVYNLGGTWDYTGYRAVELIHYDEQGKPTWFTWRADSAIIDFDQLTQI